MDSLKKFCFIFLNNHQCNFTKTISHLRLCELLKRTHKKEVNLKQKEQLRYEQKMRQVFKITFYDIERTSDIT